MRSDYSNEISKPNPNSANAWDGLADFYAKAGQWKDAVQASERAVALATLCCHS